ncbi:MAG: hypothetical protein V3V15_06655 [Sphingorhabdus sp.]
MTRLPYLFSCVGLIALCIPYYLVVQAYGSFGAASQSAEKNFAQVSMLLWYAAVAGFIWVSYKRLENAGYNPLHAFWGLLPLANLIVLIVGVFASPKTPQGVRVSTAPAADTDTSTLNDIDNTSGGEDGVVDKIMGIGCAGFAMILYFGVPVLMMLAIIKFLFS